MEDIQMVELDTKILEGMGSYCLRSKKKSIGYINKNKWLNDRFEEGLRYVQLIEDKKQVGFIEYTEAEFSSRVVHADNYLVIHCLWVSENGKGYGTKLINKCLQDARKLSKLGVVVVTNPETSWTPSKDIFIKNNFNLVDRAPFNFELLVYQFENNTPLPYFPSNWDERVEKFHNLTIIRSFQCPYVEIATENIITGANKLGVEVKIIDLKNREELMEISPTPYGIFSVIYKEQLITFHRLTVHSVIKRLKELI
ncbi:GNAT family N-acetyltransferase [Neobacillus sp. NPDC093127]|uniref:GNAT family N-acetyltransferase n=1 Tax=Neobacillus sp. NPDC093127 TaxID=3364296 RepID=UPI0038154E64